MSVDELTMRIAASWRDLRRIKQREWSTPMPLGQIDTLDVVSRIGPCSMLELSAALRIDASTATRAIEPLVKAELVRRQRSDRDARTVLVRLTPAGRALSRQLTLERVAAVEQSLADFSRPELETLAELLERMVAGVLLNNEGDDDS